MSNAKRVLAEIDAGDGFRPVFESFKEVTWATADIEHVKLREIFTRHAVQDVDKLVASSTARCFSQHFWSERAEDEAVIVGSDQIPINGRAISACLVLRTAAW